MSKVYTEDSAFVVFEACGIYEDAVSGHLYLESNIWETRVCLTEVDEHDKIIYAALIDDKGDGLLEINFAKLIEKKTSYQVSGSPSTRLVYIRGTVHNGYGDPRLYSQLSRYAQQEHDKAMKYPEREAHDETS